MPFGWSSTIGAWNTGPQGLTMASNLCDTTYQGYHAAGRSNPSARGPDQICMLHVTSELCNFMAVGYHTSRQDILDRRRPLQPMVRGWTSPIPKSLHFLVPPVISSPQWLRSTRQFSAPGSFQSFFSQVRVRLSSSRVEMAGKSEIRHLTISYKFDLELIQVSAFPA